MSILTRDVILRELEEGRIRVEPMSACQVGPASIDLHLGSELRVPSAHENGPVPVRDDGEPEPASQLIPFEDPYVLEPGQTVLGVTREKLTLPPDICAWIEGRSCIARLGLTVHVTSGFIQPGVSNHQVLEMSNVAGVALELYPGTRICQIVLQRTEGEAVYDGRFAAQDSP